MNNLIPTIETDRLLLRAFNLSDSKEVQRLAGDKKVAEVTATIPHPYPDGVAEEWIKNHQADYSEGTNVCWAIELKADRKLIGCVALGISKKHKKAEIGYWIGVDYWNKGFCSEAAKEAVNYAFTNLSLNKITSRHLSVNPASGKVMQKIGMVQEGCLAQDFSRDGEFLDMIIYGLLKS
jgi:ribosomal-protein-alanine N-acetyltransferase